MRRITLGLLVCLLACTGKPDPADRILITVKRNYSIPKKAEPVAISIDWDELTTRLPQLKKSSFTVTDQNFGKVLPVKLADADGDQNPDYIVLDYSFDSNEPVFTFLVVPSEGKRQEVVSESVVVDDRLEIGWLIPFPIYEKRQGTVSDVASKIVQSTLNLYPDVKDFPIYAPNRWNYEYSFFLAGSYKLGTMKNNQDFIDYPQKWLDSFINDTGFKEGVYDMEEYKLDDVIPARLAIWFHQQTGLPKYKAVADTIALQLQRQPKTSDGGYWHKQVYPDQMWLDGVFMGDVYSMHYAQAYDQPEWYDEAVHQIKLIYKHTLDSATGLLYHGWDESINPVWAHPDRGTSPEFWGRAVGWYAMALVECLDYLPDDHPERADIISILQKVSSSVINYQDKDSRLWYQVMDKGNQPGNWIEASCSAMFAYAFAKGHHQGFLDKKYLNAAEEAYNSILKNYVYADDQGNLHLDQTVKIGTLNPKNSKGDYEYYITTERRINDYKGLAALLFASIELNR